MEYVIWYASSTSDFLSILSDQFSKRSLFRCCRNPDDPGHPDCAFSASPGVSATNPSTAVLFGRAGPELRNTRHVAGLGSFCVRRWAEETVGLRSGHGREAAVTYFFNENEKRRMILTTDVLFRSGPTLSSTDVDISRTGPRLQRGCGLCAFRCIQPGSTCIFLCDSSIDGIAPGPLPPFLRWSTGNTGGGRRPKFSVCLSFRWYMCHFPVISCFLPFSFSNLFPLLHSFYSILFSSLTRGGSLYTGRRNHWGKG